MGEMATHFQLKTTSLRLSDMSAHMVYHSDQPRANKYSPVMGKQGTEIQTPLFLWASETGMEAFAKHAGVIE